MSEPAPYDAGNPEHVKRKRTKADLRAERDAADLAMVMSTLPGRRWMWAHLERCGVYRLSYMPGAIPTDTAFREGERNVGNHDFNALMVACPEGYATMCREKSEGQYE